MGLIWGTLKRYEKVCIKWRENNNLKFNQWKPNFHLKKIHWNIAKYQKNYLDKLNLSFGFLYGKNDFQIPDKSYKRDEYFWKILFLQS
jgi:hypothetical protein